MSERINKSWREQAKPIVAYEGVSEMEMEFKSLWDASTMMCHINHCRQDTAKKEIRKAIKLNLVRYGFKWRYK